MAITDKQMVEGRFARWAKYRALIRRIRDTLAAGGKVQISTYTHSTLYDARHVSLFVAARNGAFVRRGKGTVCISGCDIRFYR